MYLSAVREGPESSPEICRPFCDVLPMFITIGWQRGGENANNLKKAVVLACTNSALTYKGYKYVRKFTKSVALKFSFRPNSLSLPS